MQLFFYVRLQEYRANKEIARLTSQTGIKKALQAQKSGSGFPLAAWNCRDQPLSIRVRRTAEDLRGRSEFYDLAAIHDCDVIADLAGYAQIMGDEDHRHVEEFLNFRQ